VFSSFRNTTHPKKEKQTTIIKVSYQIERNAAGKLVYLKINDFGGHPLNKVTIEINKAEYEWAT